MEVETLPSDLGSTIAPLPAIGPRLADVHSKLVKPFPLALVEVKPGATTKDKTRALALAYVDPRAVQTRLDRVVGPENWSIEYRPVGERAVIARLTILGIVREDIGECSDPGDPNAWTVAVAQAFKRAAAAFGIGRYLYRLPQLWRDYDQDKKALKDPAGLAARMYHDAGIEG